MTWHQWIYLPGHGPIDTPQSIYGKDNTMNTTTRKRPSRFDYEQRLDAIVAYCRRTKRSGEIAAKFGYSSTSIHEPLKHLMTDGRLRRRKRDHYIAVNPISVAAKQAALEMGDSAVDQPVIFETEEKYARMIDYSFAQKLEAMAREYVWSADAQMDVAAVKRFVEWCKRNA